MAIIDRRGIAVNGAAPSAADMPDVALAIKLAVRVATTADITLAGLQTVDGVGVVEGNRVLVKNQADATQNGIYVVSSGSWSRAVDFDASPEIASGVVVLVSAGSVGAQAMYQLTTADPIALDTSGLTWTVVSGEVGPQGEKGDKGDKGDTGNTGAAGATGIAGVSGTSALTRVRAVATVNVAIATALENGDTLDGVTLTANDVVLLTAQTNTYENGLYVVPASGAAARHTDFATYDALPGTYFSVMEGAAKADTLWRCTSNRGGTIGSTAVAIAEASFGGFPASDTVAGVVELATNAEVQGRTDASRAVTPAGFASATRELLLANRTYYVRTDGNDGNNGRTNTPGGAFLTVQKAIDVVAALDLAIYDVIIQVGAGTYTAAVTLKTLVGAGQVLILGDASTPSNVLISVTSNNAISANNIAGRWRLQGLKLSTVTSGSGMVVFGPTTTVDFLNIDFGACALRHINAGTGALLLQVGNYSITGGAASHLFLNTHSVFTPNGAYTTTLTGTPALSTNFVNVDGGAYATFATSTFSGSATGSRYNVANGGVIVASGVTLPGNAAGVGTNLGASPFGLYI